MCMVRFDKDGPRKKLIICVKKTRKNDRDGKRERERVRERERERVEELNFRTCLVLPCHWELGQGYCNE